MNVTINGVARDLPEASTVAELLGTLELDPRAVVVELNREIIKRAQVDDTSVGDGDVIEIVHFVGGG